MTDKELIEKLRCISTPVCENHSCIGCVYAVAEDPPEGLLSDSSAEVPMADTDPVRHGRWVPVYESQITGWNPEFAGYDPIADYCCSVCGKDTILDCNDELVLSTYCPNCGARMDGGADNG